MGIFNNILFYRLFSLHYSDSLLRKDLKKCHTYPEQQLPGVPHELGVPQQPPEPDSVDPRDGAMTVL